MVLHLTPDTPVYFSLFFIADESVAFEPANMSTGLCGSDTDKGMFLIVYDAFTG